MAQPLRFYQKKCLREDDHKDEPTLDRTPTTGGGSGKVRLAKKTEHAVVERQTPEGSDRNERESSSSGHAMGDKRRPRPSESFCAKKPLEEYSTPLLAQGLLSGINTRVPEEEELMTINIDSTEQSRA